MAENPLFDEARLAALRDTGLLDSSDEVAFDRLTRLASRLLQAPVALVSLVDDQRQFFKSSIGLPEPWRSLRQTPLTHSFCQYAVRMAEPLLVEDARVDPRVRDNLAIVDLGVIAYAGIPMRTSEGHVLGSFCVIDSSPRQWTPAEVETLTELSQSVVTEMELRTVVRRQAQANRLLKEHESEHETLMAQLKTERVLLSSLVEQLPTGVLLAEIPSGRITLHNRGFSETLRLAAGTGEAIELDKATIFRPDGTQYGPNELPLSRAVHQGVTIRNEEATLRRPQGDVHLLLSATPVEVAEGCPVAAIGTFVDITELKEAQLSRDELTQREMAAPNTAEAVQRRYQDLVQGLDAIVWESESQQNDRFSFISEQAERILGFDKQQFIDGRRRWLDVVHPEDRARLQSTRAAAWTHGQKTDCIYRIVAMDGHVVWLQDRMYLCTEEDSGKRRLRGVMSDVTTLKQLEQELQQRASELARTDRRKDEFLATLAHELRNPLAPISNALDILELGDPPADRRAELRDVMRSQTQLLIRLIDDLMDVSRINRGKIRLHRTPTPLDEIVRAAMTMVEPMREERHHEVVFDLAKQPIVLNVDRVRMVQVVSNLLSNACKYTPPHGRIDVRTRLVGDQVELSVQDNGQGIDSSLLQDIFGLFTQEEPDSDQSIGGLGIGLTIVRRLMEMHGGKVIACSDGRGHGSTFSVRLPYAKDLKLEEVPEAKQMDTTGQVPILVVEDTPAVAKMFALMLETMGHQVKIAHSGEQALDILDEFKPRLVFSDISMPGIDGYTFAKRLRARHDTRDVRLIALTGYGQPGDRRKGREAGFDDHIVKPPDMQTLQSVLKDL